MIMMCQISLAPKVWRHRSIWCCVTLWAVRSAEHCSVHAADYHHQHGHPNTVTHASQTLKRAPHITCLLSKAASKMRNTLVPDQHRYSAAPHARVIALSQCRNVGQRAQPNTVQNMQPPATKTFKPEPRLHAQTVNRSQGSRPGLLT